MAVSPFLPVPSGLEIETIVTRQTVFGRSRRERLLPFIEPWARMTTRLAQALFDIGRATCGKLGARLAARLGMPTSWMTILRRIMAVPTPSVGLVSQLGLDDWSFRRRHQFHASHNLAKRE
jgi:hypothetical protein